MPTVWADNEEVTFTEGAPQEPANVYELLMGALSEQGRAVVKFIVDGDDALAKGEFPESYEKIEITSLSHDELTLRLVTEALNHLSETKVQLQAYAQNVLNIAWSEVFKRMEEFIQKIQPFADLVDNLGPYVSTYSPPWRKDFEDLPKINRNHWGKFLTHLRKVAPPHYPSNSMMDLFPCMTVCGNYLRLILFLSSKVKLNPKERNNDEYTHA